MTRKILLGIDPGTKNYAISVIYYSNKKHTVRKAFMFKNPIVLMDDTLESNTIVYIEAIKKILLKYKPESVGIELFMARSFRSNLGIPIMYMVGIVSVLCIKYGIKIYPVMPSTWKRAFKKEVVDIKQIYDRSYPIKARLPDHLVDSTMIGIFSRHKTFKGVKLTDVQEIIKCLKESFISANPELKVVQILKKQKKLKK